MNLPRKLCVVVEFRVVCGNRRQELEAWTKRYKEKATAANKTVSSSHQHEEKHQLYIKQSVTEQRNINMSSTDQTIVLITGGTQTPPYFLLHTFFPPLPSFLHVPNSPSISLLTR